MRSVGSTACSMTRAPAAALGLVPAARGELSRDDLVELSGEAPRTVDRTLRSVLGRTFHGRQNRWRNTALPVFVLAHENLQQSAAESMSRSEIEGFVGQLHAWADSYCQQGWPEQTPENLLRSYHRLMVTTGDVARDSLATDRARMDRMSTSAAVTPPGSRSSSPPRNSSARCPSRIWLLCWPWA